jgi:hypothetical protein
VASGDLKALPNGFRYQADADLGVLVENVVDRALLAMVHWLTPGYLTRGNVPKEKTRKQKEAEGEILDELLRVIVRDLGLETERGDTEPAIRDRLYELGVERGVIIEHPEDYPRWESARSYGPWTLYAVMSEERRYREGHR